MIMKINDGIYVSYLKMFIDMIHISIHINQFKLLYELESDLNKMILTMLNVFSSIM